MRTLCRRRTNTEQMRRAKAVASVGPPRYERATGPNAFTTVETVVRAPLAKHLMIPATVLVERGGRHGPITWFRDNVRGIRGSYAPVDAADRVSIRRADAHYVAQAWPFVWGPLT